MATNPIADALPQLFASAEDAADGAHDHGAAVNLQQNTEARIRADLAAARAAENAYAAAKTLKDTRSGELRIADSNARAFLKAARAVLAQNLGEDWTAAWEVTGFPGQSTAVPGTQDERMTLCSSLNNYFTNNPAMEVNTANLVVTAVRADALFTAFSNARNASNNANSAAAGARNGRDGAVNTLKTRLRGLIAELGQLLDDTSPLWDAFGLNAPGAAATLPGDVPEALIATPGATGTVHVEWADARNATRYRVWKQIVSVDADFVAVATVTDSDATLSGLPDTRTVKLRVTAVNDGGESLPSVEISVVVP
ncbi:MAG: fibronectin type III domain-containing protein [Verrucomicrobia bacterium]|nr:fibronectin type III domain-containing protein [Verrucomicrobiota bacterium]